MQRDALLDRRSLSAAPATIDQVAEERLAMKRSSLFKRFERKQVSSVQFSLQLTMLDQEAAVLLPAAKKVETCIACDGHGYERDGDGEDYDRCSLCHDVR